MSILRRVGKVGMTAGKGGRRLHHAAEDAEDRTGPVDAGGAVDPADEVDTRLTVGQAVSLFRYGAAQTVLHWLEWVFLAKYTLLLISVVFLSGLDTRGEDRTFELSFERTTEGTVIGGILVVLFLSAALGQWLFTRLVKRLGQVDKLSGIEDHLLDASVAWYPNLRAEFRRVDLNPRPRRMFQLGTRYATRRLSDHERTALDQINWRAVLPTKEWTTVRQLLAKAAAAPPLQQ